jgi:hypothetical protein
MLFHSFLADAQSLRHASTCFAVVYPVQDLALPIRQIAYKPS